MMSNPMNLTFFLFFFSFHLRPNCNSTLFNAWDSLLNETESDAVAHTDIAGVFGRAVSRPLLEKTFHMKIQSRTVFLHRESFDTILDKTEQMLLKVSNFKYIKKMSNHIRLNLETCDLTEFSTSLEYFGVVKFRPNCSSNHSASLAFHLDCSNPGL